MWKPKRTLRIKRAKGKCLNAVGVVDAIADAAVLDAASQDAASR